MTTQEAAEKYGIDQGKFEDYLNNSRFYYYLIKNLPNGSIRLGNAEMEKAVEDFRVYQDMNYVSVRDLVSKYKIPKETIEQFVKEKHIVTVKFEDSYCIARVVIDNYFPKESERYRLQIKSRREKPRIMSSMLITSGFSFDGYTITRYSGYISGDGIESVDRQLYNTGGLEAAILKAISDARKQAVANLKESAYDLSCNAVIGVDFDYISMEPEAAILGGRTVYQPYVFIVSANGNAVVIEKEKGKSRGQ